jgi:hypothetical protein
MLIHGFDALQEHGQCDCARDTALHRIREEDTATVDPTFPKPISIAFPSTPSQFAMLYDSDDVAQLDHQIAALERQLADLKARRNAYKAPLCQLPPELVARIFHFTQRLSDGEAYFESCTQTPWINFDNKWAAHYTPVCRRLRGVAINTPSLWTFVKFNPFAEEPSVWTKLCVERAKDSPLQSYVDAELPWPEGDDAPLPPLSLDGSAYMKRSHTLFFEVRMITWIYGYARRAYQVLFTTPLPTVRYLFCNMELQNLPLRFTHNTTVSLRHLHLSSVSLNEEAYEIHLPALRSMKLLVHQMAGGVPQLVALLNTAPFLESLDIEFNYGQNTESEQGPRCSLPHLQHLRLTGSSGVVSACVELLPLPSRSLYINTEEYTSFMNRHPLIYDYVQRFWMAASNGQPFPPGHTDDTNHHAWIVCGTERSRDETARSPHLYFREDVMFLAWDSDFPRPLLECLDTVHIWSDLTWGSLCRRRDPPQLELPASIRHVVVQECRGAGALEKLGSWVQGRARAGRRVETVTFLRDRSKLATVQLWEQNGIVGKVLCADAES